jgi:tetratricopeptide (TPR) repeat protein
MARETAKKSSRGKKGAVVDVREAINSGIKASERGEREAAHKIFRDTAELHPNTSEVWVWLGGTSANLDDAEAAFEKAYALDPENEQASLGLRWVRLRRKAELDRMVGVGASVPLPVAAPVPLPAQGDSPPATATGDAVMGTAPMAVAKSTITCPNCARENPANEKFCVDCGQDLSAALTQATGEATGAAKPLWGISTPALVAIVFAIVVIAAAIFYLTIM